MPFLRHEDSEKPAFCWRKKAPRNSRGFYDESRRRPTLPRSSPRSTIGAEELNFRVRYGNGCVLFAIATENLYVALSCQPSSQNLSRHIKAES